MRQLFRVALEQDAALKQQVGTVGNGKGFVHIMVGNKDANVAILQSPHNVLNVFHSNGVDTRKGLVEHDKLRVDGQAARYLGAAALATRQLVAHVLAHLA